MLFLAIYRSISVILFFTLFLVSTLLQLVWFIGFFSPLALSSQAKNGKYPVPPYPTDDGVSVIICAHNELENLKRLIPLLATQDHPRYELIVVNDRSQDDSKQWLERQHLLLPNLKLITVSRVPQGINPKKHALLLGIQSAQYDVLLLTDADCYPVSNSWISLMAGKFTESIDIVLGYSGYESAPGLLNKLIRYETLITAIQYLSRALSKKPYMGVGRNLSYRKSYFQRVGGLKNVLGLTGGDDDLFVNKHATGINTCVCINTGAHVLSKPKSSWNAYFRQKLRHLSVGKYYKNRDKWVLGIFSASHIIFWSSLVSLLTASMLVNWVVAGFLIRQLTLSWIVGKSSKVLGERINIFYIPLLDFLYSIFYLYTGLATLFRKNIDWH